MKLLRICNEVALRKLSAGSVLVEFAFISLAFYLLFAGTLELGRMIIVSQAIQNAARVGARELALVALPPTATFQEALDHPDVIARIYNPRLLAIDIGVSQADPNTNSWPIINRMLAPVMIHSRVAGSNFLHFPGAVLRLPDGSFTVGVPKVISTDSGGATTVRWLPVLEEVRAEPDVPESGPFSLASTGPERGLVALRINCPYQATTLTAYRTVGTGPNALNEPVLAGPVDAVNAAPEGGSPIDIQPASGNPLDGGFNVGTYGLGEMYVGGGPAVRPFRRLISTQSIFRREVFAQ